MKKNFIKKTVACSLAFAMAASTIPFATVAEAAKAPALNKTGKVLYVNENEVGSSFNFNIVNGVKGSTYKWSISDKTIASVNYKTGVVTAKKVGTVKVYCKITLPTKKTKTLRATVSVKENAVKAEISNPVASIGVNEEYNFNRTFTTASGGKSTDYQNWVIDEASNKAGATVNAKNGVVTATKTGSFKIKVQAYQSAAKLAAGDVVESDWVTVNVPLAVTEVAQAADNKIVLTYNDTMTADNLKASEISIKDSNNVVQNIKSLAFDGKKVTVTLWSTLVDKKAYTVAYADKTSNFTASVGAVASVEIKTAQVVFGTATAIEYVLKDANGIDVTASKGTASNVVIEADTTNGYLDSSKKLTLFAKDNTAKVTVTYHTYEYDSTGNETGKATATATITAVDATTATIGSFDKFTLATAAPDFAKDTMNSVIAIGDTGYSIFVKATDSKSNALVTTVGAANSVVAKYETSDNSILLVDTNGAVTGVKAGDAYVLAYDAKGAVIWSFQVKVVASRTASALSIEDNKTSVSVTNSATAAAVVSVKGIVKDQHGKTMTGQALQMLDSTGAVDSTNAPISKPSTTATAPVATISGTTVSFAGASATKGTYKYMFNVVGTNLRTVVTVVVTEPDATATSVYQLELDKATVDTTISATSVLADTDVTVKLGEYKGGVLNSYQTITAADVTVTKVDNSTVTLADTTSGSAVKVSTLTTSGSTVSAKAATGTYKVSVVYSGMTLVKYFTVTDSQSAPAVATDEIKAVTSTTITAAANECFTIGGTSNYTITGVTYKSSIPVATDATTLTSGTTYNVYVEDVTVNVTIGTYTVATKVAVGKTITIVTP